MLENLKEAIFNSRGGYPILTQDVTGYFKESLYCEKCKEIKDDYDISIGLLFTEGFICRDCGNYLDYTKIIEITELEHLEEYNNIAKRCGINA